MPVFEYKAVSAKGKNLKGVIDAPSSNEARSRLRRDGLYLTELVESAGTEGTPSAPGNIKFSRGVPTQDMTIMVRQLATLVASGIPLVDSLNALIEQVENLKLKSTLSDVRERVNEGSTLADAMGHHPKVFNNLFVNMIRAGEASGALDIVLNRLADFFENQSRLKGKILSALAYPAIMLLGGAAALILIFALVIPRLVQMYDDLGQELPLPTQILIGTSQIFTSYWYIALGVCILLYFGFNYYIGTESGKRRYHRFLLHVPMFGSFVRMVAISRFASTLSTLLASGVPILKAMDIVRNVVNNVVLADVIQEVRTNVSEGDSIADPLRRSGEFPPLVTHMIAIGEKTGEVESMLGKVSETYSNMVDARVSTLTSLLEPIIIIVMAVVIGAIVLSVMLPIFQMGNSI